MTYTYLIIYLYRCCSREGEFTGSFFYYTDKKSATANSRMRKKQLKKSLTLREQKVKGNSWSTT